MNPDNIQDIIKARFKELPPEVQTAITSTSLSDKFDMISKKYSLRIDQSGSLQTETLLVMLGLEKPADYVENLVANAELSRSIASLIAADVNTEILGSIRMTLEKITSEENEERASEVEAQKPAVAPPSNKDIEKAGDMSFEKNLASEDVVSGANKPAETLSRVATLNALENPPAFVDHLLTGTVTSTSETVVKEASTAGSQPEASKPATPIAPIPQTPPAPVAPAPYKRDPYRESIE